MGRYLFGFAALMMVAIVAGFVWSQLERPDEQVADAAVPLSSPGEQATEAPIQFAQSERQFEDSSGAPAPPGPQVFAAPDDQAAVEASVTYSGCNEVRALGKAPLHMGEPGYRADMDGDGDGLACEPIRSSAY